MGLLLDLAVVVLAVAVTVSLGLLAWTLAVTAVTAVGRARRRVTDARASLAASQARLAEASSAARATLGRVSARVVAATTSGAAEERERGPGPGEDA
ncbi:MAG: hypothetical protein ACRDGV_11095 [Candidatus Limnocylindria bacterium]